MIITLLTLLCLGSICYYLACLAAARRFFARPPVNRLSRFPPVSILIPLSGKDFEAYDNYATFCRQDYPDYQIVFGVNDADDSSIPVIRQLIADFPENDITLVTDPTAIGANPKVNNLQNMLGKARHEVLVLVDSDIRVDAAYLVTVVSELADDRVGMVTCLYRAGKAPSLAAKLEAVGITTEFAPGVLVAWLIEGISFALGATIATTKENLQAIGGFQAIADYLADDFMLGKLMSRAGLDVRLSSHIVEIVLPPTTLKSMLKHQIRWARGIRACRPWGHLGAIVTHGTALALLLVIASWGSAMSLAILTATLLSRLAVVYSVAIRRLGDNLLLRNLWLVPARDLLGFLLWCLGQVGKTVEWRERVFKLTDDGKMVLLENRERGAISDH
jgi:ceramide glucosyltransferase